MGFNPPLGSLTFFKYHIRIYNYIITYSDICSMTWNGAMYKVRSPGNPTLFDSCRHGDFFASPYPDVPLLKGLRSSGKVRPFLRPGEGLRHLYFGAARGWLWCTGGSNYRWWVKMSWLSGHVNQVLNIHDMTIDNRSDHKISQVFCLRVCGIEIHIYIYIYTLYNILNIHVCLATIINALSDVCPFHQVASRNCPEKMSGPQKFVGQKSPWSPDEPGKMEGNHCLPSGELT